MTRLLPHHRTLGASLEPEQAFGHELNLSESCPLRRLLGRPLHRRPFGWPLHGWHCAAAPFLVDLCPEILGHPRNPPALSHPELETTIKRESSLIQYNTIQYNTIQYNTIRYDTIRYNTIRYNTIRYNTIRYNTIPYHTIQYNTIQHNTTQHNIA